MVSCTAGTPTSRLRPSGPVVSALGSESEDPGCSRGRGGQGVVPLRRAGKKMRVPLLGLAKSIN